MSAPEDRVRILLDMRQSDRCDRNEQMVFSELFTDSRLPKALCRLKQSGLKGLHLDIIIDNQGKSPLRFIGSYGDHDSLLVQPDQVVRSENVAVVGVRSRTRDGMWGLLGKQGTFSALVYQLDWKYRRPLYVHIVVGYENRDDINTKIVLRSHLIEDMSELLTAAGAGITNDGLMHYIVGHGEDFGFALGQKREGSHIRIALYLGGRYNRRDATYEDCRYADEVEEEADSLSKRVAQCSVERFREIRQRPGDPNHFLRAMQAEMARVEGSR